MFGRRFWEGMDTFIQGVVKESEQNRLDALVKRPSGGRPSSGIQARIKQARVDALTDFNAGVRRPPYASHAYNQEYNRVYSGFEDMGAQEELSTRTEWRGYA
jgi:hypothetical protein